MTEKDVLDKVISILRDVNAVEPGSTDEEIANMQLPDLPFFEMHHEDRKGLLHEFLVKGLADLYGGNEPSTSPNNGTVFDRKTSIKKLAAEIYDDN